MMNLIVEITPPYGTHAENLESVNMFDSFVIYIEYLKKLREVGFDVDMITPGCICCASLKVEAIPEDNILLSVTV